jgi:hypothetical protein
MSTLENSELDAVVAPLVSPPLSKTFRENTLVEYDQDLEDQHLEVSSNTKLPATSVGSVTIFSPILPSSGLDKDNSGQTVLSTSIIPSIQAEDRPPNSGLKTTEWDSSTSKFRSCNAKSPKQHPASDFY